MDATCFYGLKLWDAKETAQKKNEYLSILPVEMSRQGQFLATDNDDLATLQKVLGDNGCKSTDQMAATVDNYGLEIENICMLIKFVQIYT